MLIKLTTNVQVIHVASHIQLSPNSLVFFPRFGFIDFLGFYSAFQTQTIFYLVPFHIVCLLVKYINGGWWCKCLIVCHFLPFHFDFDSTDNIFDGWLRMNWLQVVWIHDMVFVGRWALRSMTIPRKTILRWNEKLNSWKCSSHRMPISLFSTACKLHITHYMRIVLAEAESLISKSYSV